MNDVVVGVGELDGKGVYADRDFVAGDVVMSYRLQPLTRAEFTALPLPERQFVHSYVFVQLPIVGRTDRDLLAWH